MRITTCKYCGKPLRNRDSVLCEDCHPYAGQAQILKRFQFTGTLKEQYDQLVHLILDMYLKEEVGVTEIWKRLGISYRTTQRILEEQGFRTRNLSEGIAVGIKKGRVNLPKGEPKQYRRGEHISWEGKKYWLRSSYEFEYAKELDNLQVPYTVEPFRVQYFDSQKGKTRSAVPDFYLPKTNELVEIKSTWTFNEQEMRDKFKAYREAGYCPKLILDKKIVEI